MQRQEAPVTAQRWPWEDEEEVEAVRDDHSDGSSDWVSPGPEGNDASPGGGEEGWTTPAGGGGSGILAQGSQGPSVAKLQESLNVVGAAEPLLIPDGDFGARTHAAVVNFQEASGLQGDGIVGPLTHEALPTSALVGSAGPAPSGTPTPAATTPGAAGGTAGQAPPGTAGGTGGLGAPFGCRYPDPAEKERSKTSPGFMLEESPTTFVLGDFANNSSTLKEAHQAGLAQLVSRFDLRSAASKHKVTIIEGLTDCAGGFEQNSGLRRQRALETKLDLIKQDGGALGSNVPAEPVAAFFATEPAGNETPQGRARNRGVRLVIESESEAVPEAPDPTGTAGPPLCLNDRPMAKKWGLQGRAGVSGGGGALGAGVDLFTLFDLDPGHDRSYSATFGGGDVGLGTPVQVTINNPLESPETFETDPDPVCPEAFNGSATISGAEGPFFPGIPIGFEVAAIDLPPATKPEGISIGGLEIIFGASGGVAKGFFTVFS